MVIPDGVLPGPRRDGGAWHFSTSSEQRCRSVRERAVEINAAHRRQTAMVAWARITVAIRLRCNRRERLEPAGMENRLWMGSGSVVWVSTGRWAGIASRFILSDSEGGQVKIGTIGIIGGLGFIGRALAQALLEQKIVPPDGLILSARTVDPSRCLHEVRCTSNNEWLAAESDVVIVSVRPEQFSTVRVEVKEGCLLISVMAGVSAAVLAERTHALRIVRAMPNAGVSIGRSYTPFYAHPGVSAEDRRLVHGIFDAVGKCDEVQSEADLDYMTGLTGSGPAFVALLAEAMRAHGISRGLDPKLVCEGVRATIEGAAEILGRGALCPNEVLEGLEAYRGTTAAALQVMRREGLASIVAQALEAAERRARTMYPDNAQGGG